jgi:lysozyme family protein
MNPLLLAISIQTPINLEDGIMVQNKNFDKAFQVVVGLEGGYVNHPNDPGGETKFGITKKSYPNLNIQNLTIDQAKEIYKRDFWDKIYGDYLPYKIGLLAFDAAVNHGVRSAIKILQKTLGTTDDGIFGDDTYTELINSDPDKFSKSFVSKRLDFYSSLSTWPSFGKGWTRRMATMLKET